jgi:hypothetical protein
LADTRNKLISGQTAQLLLPFLLNNLDVILYLTNLSTNSMAAMSFSSNNLAVALIRLFSRQTAKLPLSLISNSSAPSLYLNHLSINSLAAAFFERKELG